jgi:acetyltransferase
MKGNLAFISQSCSVQAAVLDWATSNGIGFSYVISAGNMVDVDVGDMLDYLAIDLNTKAILMYIESITQPRKFMSAARVSAAA